VPQSIADWAIVSQCIPERAPPILKNVEDAIVPTSLNPVPVAWRLSVRIFHLRLLPRRCVDLKLSLNQIFTPLGQIAIGRSTFAGC
jgi:hypothetical protein